MEKLRTPLMINAIYLFLLGLTTLTPSLAQSVFGIEVKDPAVLRVLSGIFFAFGIVVWSISRDAARYGGLAPALVAGLVIAIVFLAWSWAQNLFTARTALMPIIINAALAVWIWSARPKS